MVDIDVADGMVTFRVGGLHKLWALKSRLVVPVQAIAAVEGPEAVPRWAGWRIAGTAMPGLITAGTYRRDGAWTFWDVVQAHNAIVVTCGTGGIRASSSRSRIPTARGGR